MCLHVSFPWPPARTRGQQKSLSPVRDERLIQNLRGTTLIQARSSMPSMRAYSSASTGHWPMPRPANGRLPASPTVCLRTASGCGSQGHSAMLPAPAYTLPARCCCGSVAYLSWSKPFRMMRLLWRSIAAEMRTVKRDVASLEVFEGNCEAPCLGRSAAGRMLRGTSYSAATEEGTSRRAAWAARVAHQRTRSSARPRAAPGGASVAVRPSASPHVSAVRR